MGHTVYMHVNMELNIWVEYGQSEREYDGIFAYAHNRSAQPDSDVRNESESASGRILFQTLSFYLRSGITPN